jgi:ribonuclease P protein subunit RPR2
MPQDPRRIASERIRTLLTLAQRNQKTHPERSRRYTYLARRIASRNRLHMPRDLKRLICPSCKSYMGPAASRIRIRQEREPHVALTCLRCGHVTRIPLREIKP